MAEGDHGASPPRTRWWWAALAALVAVRVIAVVVLIVVHANERPTMLSGDLDRYNQIATSFGVPYRDFQVEYPPLTYTLIRALHFQGRSMSLAAVAVASLAFDLGTAAVLARGWRARTGIVYLALGLPFVIEPFLYLRVDLLPVFLVAAGLALTRRRYDTAAGGAFALAVLAKIWPFAVLGVLVVERRWKALVAGAVGGAFLMAVWWRQAGTAGLQQVVSFREATGWQTESLPGILWHLRDPSRVKFESGAWRTGIMPVWARPLLTVLSLVFVVLAWWWAWRRSNDPDTSEPDRDLAVYGWAPLAAVLALLIFAPIVSPQYISWILPAAAIVAAVGHRFVGWLTFAITSTTAFTFLMLGEQPQGLLLATVPVLVRNILLVVLFVVVCLRLRGDGARPATVTTSLSA